MSTENGARESISVGKKCSFWIFSSLLAKRGDNYWREYIWVPSIFKELRRLWVGFPLQCSSYRFRGDFVPLYFVSFCYEHNLSCWDWAQSSSQPFLVVDRGQIVGVGSVSGLGVWAYANVGLPKPALTASSGVHTNLRRVIPVKPGGSKCFLPLGYWLWFVTKPSVRHGIFFFKNEQPTNQPKTTHASCSQSWGCKLCTLFCFSFGELLHFWPRNSWSQNKTLDM